MRVNVFSFINPLIHNGGGEMVSRVLILKGRQRGHDIRISSVRPSENNKHDRPELNLLIDIHNIGHSWRSLGAWRGFDESALRHSVAQAPFVHMTNAYSDVCNLPYLPCTGKPDTKDQCPVKPGLSAIRRRLLMRDPDIGCYAHHKKSRWLYTEAALNVYVSPLHQQITEILLALKTPPPSYILPPVIDTQRFFNLGLERDIDYLFAGVISEAKGLNEMRERFRDTNIVLLGRRAPGTTVDFGTHLDHVPYAEMPSYMNRAKHFVFLPRWPEPQGRVVAEAALCGCKIIANDNVGALSFKIDLSKLEHYAGVEEAFWKRVETIPT